MKLTSLHLLLLLLLILIVATMFKKGSEGFTSMVSTLTDPDKMYANLVQLDDTEEIYYDTKNGNVYTFAETAGATKTYSVKLIQRNGTVNNYSTADTLNDTIKKIITGPMTMATGSWIVMSPNKTVMLTYISRDNFTYLYTVKFPTETPAVAGSGTAGQTGYVAAQPAYTASYTPGKLYFYNGSTLQFTPTVSSNSVPLSKTSEYVKYSPDSSDSKEIIEPMYDGTKRVIQLVKGLRYDKQNGNLIVSTSDNKINVYKRGSGSISYTYSANAPADGSEASKMRDLVETYDPKIIKAPVGNLSVIYWPSGKETLILIYENYRSLNDPRDLVMLGTYQIANSSTTPGTGSGSGSGTGSGSGSGSGTGTDNKDKDANGDAIMDEFNRWSKYMLKTQVVPPVCPACPSCNPNSGVCTSCGGQGGSGTQSNTGTSLAIKDAGISNNNVSDVKGPSTAVASLGKSATGAISDTTSTVGNIANTAIGTAGNLASGTVGAATNLVGGTVNAATGLIGGTVGTAANLVSGTIGTAADLLKSTGSGLTNFLGGANDMTRVGYNQSYGYNRNNTGVDPATLGPAPKQSGTPMDVYSYNGALQSKGSNYRPLTADFSSFSK